jgi:diaminopimelate decarboxylase
MTELIRPALYGAHHEVVPLMENEAFDDQRVKTTIVGPVCETTDVLARDVSLPPLQSGDLVAILDAGAYGMVMASNYNARPRPPEVVVADDGKFWHVARRRETWHDLVQHEMKPPNPS